MKHAMLVLAAWLAFGWPLPAKQASADSEQWRVEEGLGLYSAIPPGRPIGAGSLSVDWEPGEVPAVVMFYEPCFNAESAEVKFVFDGNPAEAVVVDGEVLFRCSVFVYDPVVLVRMRKSATMEFLVRSPKGAWTKPYPVSLRGSSTAISRVYDRYLSFQR